MQKADPPSAALGVATIALRPGTAGSIARTKCLTMDTWSLARCATALSFLDRCTGYVFDRGKGTRFAHLPLTAR